MNKVLIVDESDYNGRTIADLLTKAGYIPVVMEDFEAAKRIGGETATRRSRNFGDEIHRRYRTGVNQPA